MQPSGIKKKPSLCLLGAIAGDVIGSAYEFHPTKTTRFELFTAHSQATDDSILTLAVADAILNQRSYRDCIQEYARAYPGRGYGGFFAQWIHSQDPQP
jgi:ADP-ribosylglycohydrolase